MKALNEYVNEVYGEYEDVIGGYVNATKENKNMDYVVVHPTGEVEFYTEDKLISEIERLKQVIDNENDVNVECEETLNMYEQIVKLVPGVWTNIAGETVNKGDLGFTIAFKYK